MVSSSKKDCVRAIACKQTVIIVLETEPFRFWMWHRYGGVLAPDTEGLNRG